MQQMRLKFRGDLLVPVPSRMVKLLKKALYAEFASVPIEPGSKTWNRRKRREAADSRKLPPQILHHLLYQEAAEQHAAQTFLAVCDRVEQCAIGRVYVRHRGFR